MRLYMIVKPGKNCFEEETGFGFAKSVKIFYYHLYKGDLKGDLRLINTEHLQLKNNYILKISSFKII